MGLKTYNSSDEKYSNVIKILQALPKEKAPENFEFNLLTRIENKNFEIKTEKQRSFIALPTWIYAPVAALVLSAVVFFIVVDISDFNLQQPLNTEQILPLESKTVTKAKPRVKAVLVPNPHYRVVVNQNDAVVKEKVPIPINPAKTVSLDKYIAGGKTSAGKNNNGMNRLVSEESSYFQFEGFLPTERDFRTLEKLRARMDSIQRMREIKSINSLNKN
jgi:hypothetical protein